MESPKELDRSRWEWLTVAALTVIGFGLRLWPVGRLGLNHFDEGIYALAASWSLLPKGLAGIDPSLIPYAPPGYPILGGIAYVVLGRSDGAMIAVSQIAGTLTIPVIAWLGRRTFGPGAGFASATFCACSGPHIAFSRMALTDVSFLLAWLLAIGAGMRFLERPGIVRAVVMGLAVGLAQEFKYNGWLAGGIVMASAGWGILIRPEERKVASILKTFGWGIFAAGVAWLVVWPWFAFVEAHGGYSGLLAHQRSYLGGWKDWEPNFLIQVDQSMALLGGMPAWNWIGSLTLASLTPWIVRPSAWVRASADLSPSRRAWMPIAAIISGCVPGFFALAPFWLGLIMAPWLLTCPRSSVRVVGVSWLVLSILTPFYHPYARLWLPYHAINWLLMGWLVVNLLPLPLSMIGTKIPSTEADMRRQGIWFTRHYLVAAALFCVGFVVYLGTLKRAARPQPGLFAPSDALYRATVRVSEILPKEVKEIRLMARPTVNFYLGTRVTLKRFADLNQLLQRGDPSTWALVDSAILRSEIGKVSGGSNRNLLDRFAKNWEVVEEIPTMPNLPTLLDLDPGLARSSSGDRTYPLWLLRPRTSKAAQ